MLHSLQWYLYMKLDFGGCCDKKNQAPCPPPNQCVTRNEAWEGLRNCAVHNTKAYDFEMSEHWKQQIILLNFCRESREHPRISTAPPTYSQYTEIYMWTKQTIAFPKYIPENTNQNPQDNRNLRVPQAILVVLYDLTGNKDPWPLPLIRD